MPIKDSKIANRKTNEDGIIVMIIAILRLPLIESKRKDQPLESAGAATGFF